MYPRMAHCNTFGTVLACAILYPMMTLIFDLDGTLINTTAAVFPAFRRTLRIFGVPAPSEEAMAKTFGLPDVEIWRTLMPSSSEVERREAFTISEQYIVEELQHLDVLLPHARETLDQLMERSYSLTVASNCGTKYLDAVLDSQGLRSVFSHPLCLGSVQGLHKEDILTAHFQRIPKHDAVMIGDRSSDWNAAKAHEIRFIGCAFGFADAAELSGAPTVIHSLPELLELFP